MTGVGGGTAVGVEVDDYAAKRGGSIEGNSKCAISGACFGGGSAGCDADFGGVVEEDGGGVAQEATRSPLLIWFPVAVEVADVTEKRCSPNGEVYFGGEGGGGGACGGGVEEDGGAVAGEAIVRHSYI